MLSEIERVFIVSIILASASPRRKEILEAVGIKPVIVPSCADEAQVKAEKIEQRVMETALLKGADVARCAGKNDFVIAADTMVVCDGKAMGKPHDKKEALAMLMMLSGKWHEVYTGYCVISGRTGEASARYEKTRVKFRGISEDEAKCYVDTREPMDKAGAYGIQGKGRLFIEKIDGDFYNVVGLPICALSVMMKNDFGIDILRQD
ncbi:MAG: Maf family protein [Clostridia bacterium]|nr:Maf family protein [Clostridia bacterium]